MNRSLVISLRAVPLVMAACLVAACVGKIDADNTQTPPASGADAGASAGSDAGGSDAGTDAGGVVTPPPSDDGGATTPPTDDGGSTNPDDGGTIISNPGQDAGTDGGVTLASDGGVFVPIAVSASVGKIKDLLVGLPPTNDEVAMVSADHTTLRGLIDQWAALPQYNAKLISFFSTAFQQSQVVNTDFASEGVMDTSNNLVLQTFKESYARTVLELIAEGLPFTEAMTTTRFMITPRLASIYAFIDYLSLNDAGQSKPTIIGPKTLTLEFSQGPIALTDSLNPASPNYMVFYDANLAKAYDPNCPTDPVSFTVANNGGNDVLGYLDSAILQGQNSQFKVSYAAGATLGAGTGTTGTVAAAAGTAMCTPPAPPSAFVATDFTTWTMIQIRKPQAGEATTNFWDLPTLRAGGDLVMNIPRVGFFTTPAFFAGWQTNASNVARVTLNQTMIVGLGKAMSPDNTTAPPSLAALDQTHAAPGTACYSCHQALDPLRQFFRHDYSLSFGPQTDPTQLSMEGQFAFYGVSVSGTSIFDLASNLAGHPMFASAWVQKLCTYANSLACDPTDPEFQRIVSVFQGSNYNWQTLVRELFSSPIVTLLNDSQNSETQGETFPIARKAHLCAAISARMGINDVCGLSATTVVPSGLRVVQTIATALPSDQYARGAEDAVLANDPSLVLRTGLENLCVAVAGQLIDVGQSPRYSSKTPTPAIADFVHTLMGITGDRDMSRITILTSHFTAAQAQGASASDALKSTFVLACLSPSVVGVGQ